MLRFSFSILLLLVTEISFAQYSETIRSSRPGQAVVPNSLGKSLIQVQSGINFGESKFNSNIINSVFEQANTLRFGLTKNFELRSTFKLRSEKLRISNAESEQLGGLSFWDIGFRYNITASDSYKPSFGIQSELSLDWVSQDFRTGGLVSNTLFIYGQKLSETFYLTTNLGSSWILDGSLEFIYAINLGFPITEKINGFIEGYGQLRNFTLRWDAGFTYLINNDFQLDLSGGYGNNGLLKDWFLDTGISWRFDTKK